MVDGAGASFVVEGKKNYGIGNAVERRRQQKPWNTLRERNKIEAGFTGGVFFLRTVSEVFSGLCQMEF